MLSSPVCGHRRWCGTVRLKLTSGIERVWASLLSMHEVFLCLSVPQDVCMVCIRAYMLLLIKCILFRVRAWSVQSILHKQCSSFAQYLLLSAMKLWNLLEHLACIHYSFPCVLLSCLVLILSFWIVVITVPYLFLLYILVTVLSFEQAPLCLWMCVSHHHFRINVTQAFSAFYNMLSISADSLLRLKLLNINEQLVCIR